MLEIRPNCECCDRDIAPTDEAYVCTFEWTWCPGCVARFRDGACPNCGGNLERRLVRPAAALVANPASTLRVVSPSCQDRLTEV